MLPPGWLTSARTSRGVISGRNLFYECVAAVVAYHPVSWRMRRRIAETRELVCDERAADAMGDRPEYAASLLRLATSMAVPAAQPIYASGDAGYRRLRCRDIGGTSDAIDDGFAQGEQDPEI